jgi:hypothetical protein
VSRARTLELLGELECASCGGPVAGAGRDICPLCDATAKIIDDLSHPGTRPAPRHEQCVYAFAPVDESLPVKIGISMDVGRRLRAIQTYCPVEIEAIGAIRCPAEYETAIHRALVDARSHGEWFHRTPPVLEVMGILRIGCLDRLREWLRLRMENQSLDGTCKVQR